MDGLMAFSTWTGYLDIRTRMDLLASHQLTISRRVTEENCAKGVHSACLRTRTSIRILWRQRPFLARPTRKEGDLIDFGGHGLGLLPFNSMKMKNGSLRNIGALLTKPLDGCTNAARRYRRDLHLSYGGSATIMPAPLLVLDRYTTQPRSTDSLPRCISSALRTRPTVGLSAKWM